MNRRSLEDRAYTGGLLVIGGLAAVASFRHVADAAIRYGQASPGWLPYALAGTPDLLAVIAGISVRRRHRVEASTRGPIALLVMAVVVLVAAQLVTAQPTFGGWFAAAWPAIAFLSVVALVETEPDRRARPASRTSDRTARPVPAAGPVRSTTAAPDRGPVTDRTTVDVADLVLVGQAVAADLARTGKPLTRAALVRGLRERGHTVGTDRASALLRTLRDRSEPVPVAASAAH